MASRTTENRSKRTNSLAFASVDCHTCSIRGNKCDRRRPQCSPCLSKGIKCAGFVTPLTWDHRRMWVSNGAKGATDTPTTITSTARPVTAKANRKFRFVGANARKELPASGQQPTSSKVTDQTTDQASDTVPPDTTNDETALPLMEESQSHCLLSNEDTDLSRSDDFVDPNLLAPVEDSSAVSVEAPSTTSTEDIPQDEQMPDFSSSSFPILSTDVSLPFMNNVMTTDAIQANFPIAEEYVDLDNIDLGEFVANYQHPFTCDLPQQNLLSAPIDLSRPFSPFKMARNAQTEPDPMSSATGLLLNPNYEVFLNIYDSELCVLPITSDTMINPFRCHRDDSRGSRLLFHSIIALCYQHLHFQSENWLEEIQEHKTEANNEMNRALTKVQSAGSDLGLLDAILVMFTFDCTISAAGSWTTHLRRARTVIDACGGPLSLNTARLRSQAGMLLWWDASLALVSRKELVFDSSYVDFLLESEENDPWSFYDLTGCPAEIIRYMVDLAELAREFELASNMKWLSFDLTPVLAIEERLLAWRSDKRPRSFASPRGATSPQGMSEHDPTSPEYRAASTEADYEEEVNASEDQRHCIEAWRRALLIYVRRVFRLDKSSTDTVGRRPSQSSSAPSRRYYNKPQWGQLWNGSVNSHTSMTGDKNYHRPSSTYSSSLHQATFPSTSSHAAPSQRTPFFSLVRSTINSIRCVRRTSQTQKQLLLPAFIAGSETSDPELRRFICSYCDWWSNKSRYKMFDTMRKLLVQVWEVIDAQSAIDKTTSADDGATTNPSPNIGGLGQDFSTARPNGVFTLNDTSTTDFNVNSTHSRGVKSSSNLDTPKGRKSTTAPWWGSVIDKNAQRAASEGAPIQYLFG